MAVEIRLCDEDWDRFGGPEWLTFDQDALDDLDTDALDRLEREMDMSIYQVRRIEMSARTVRAVKATAWLARQLSGDDTLTTPGYKAFTIKPLKVQVRTPGGDDQIPPDQDSPPNEDGEDQAASPDSSNPSTAENESETHCL